MSCVGFASMNSQLVISMSGREFSTGSGDGSGVSTGASVTSGVSTGWTVSVGVTVGVAAASS